MNKVVINDFAPLADKNATVPASGSSPYQSAGDLLDGNARELINYASFTGTGIDLLDPTLEFGFENTNVGYVSTDFSGPTKILDPAVDICIELSGGYYSAPGITFHFWQNFCTEVYVEWHDSSTETLISSATFYPNELTFYGDNPVENFNKIVISFKKTEIPYQFVKLAGIDLGKIREITDFISNIEIFTEIDPDYRDVPGSTCDFVAKVTDFKPQDLQDLYVYGGEDEMLFGKFTINRAPGIGKNLYSFECSDDVIKMHNSQYPQKEQSTYYVYNLNDDIKASSNVDIDCEDCRRTQLTGFIEKDKNARLAAAMMSFALGSFLTGFGLKTLKFIKPKNRRNKVISSIRILGKPEYTKIAPYTEIILNQYESTFDEPVDSRSAVNQKRRASIANNPLIFNKYSLVSDIDTMFEHVLEAGYERNEITARIIYNDEATGDICRIETPYDGMKTGIIKSMAISIGHRITAEIKMIERDFSSEGSEE